MLHTGCYYWTAQCNVIFTLLALDNNNKINAMQCHLQIPFQNFVINENKNNIACKKLYRRLLSENSWFLYPTWEIWTRSMRFWPLDPKYYLEFGTEISFLTIDMNCVIEYTKFCIHFGPWFNNFERTTKIAIKSKN